MNQIKFENSTDVILGENVPGACRYYDWETVQKNKPHYEICSCDVLHIGDQKVVINIKDNPWVFTHPEARRNMILYGESPVGQGGGMLRCDVGKKTIFPTVKRHKTAAIYDGFETINTSVAFSEDLWLDPEAAMLYGMFRDLAMTYDGYIVRLVGQTHKQNHIFEKIFKFHLKILKTMKVEIKGICNVTVEDWDIGRKRTLVINSNLAGYTQKIEFDAILCIDEKDSGSYIIDVLGFKRIKLPSGDLRFYDTENFSTRLSRRRIGLHTFDTLKFDDSKLLLPTDKYLKDGKLVKDSTFEPSFYTPVFQTMLSNLLGNASYI